MKVTKFSMESLPLCNNSVPFGVKFGSLFKTSLLLSADSFIVVGVLMILTLIAVWLAVHRIPDTSKTLVAA